MERLGGRGSAYSTVPDGAGKEEGEGNATLRPFRLPLLLRLSFLYDNGRNVGRTYQSLLVQQITYFVGQTESDVRREKARLRRKG